MLMERPLHPLPSSLPRRREPRISAPGAVPPDARNHGHIEGKSRFRFAGLLSFGLHAALLAGLLWFKHTPASRDAPQSLGAVELVLEERRGTDVPAAPPESVPAIAAPAPPPPPAPPAPLPRPELPAPPPPNVATADEALPLPPIPPPSVPPQNLPPQANPPVQHAQEAPQIKLGGNSDTDAIVLSGPHVIPASVDAKFRNREPVYPRISVQRAEQGAVILLIHVSPAGLPSGVDIAESSGFMLLDRAARDAVLGWHFVPAVQDGQPIPFDMKLRVVFNLE
jgi:periplasmic protein TonB